MTTHTDEMIEQGRKAREGHYLRVCPVSCTCGWKSDTYIEADGLPRFEAHLVELALEAVAPLIAAKALRDASEAMRRCKDAGHWNLRDPRDPEVSYSPDAWLSVYADRIERADS